VKKTEGMTKVRRDKTSIFWEKARKGVEYEEDTGKKKIKVNNNITKQKEKLQQ
jgi:hypothetical protein